MFDYQVKNVYLLILCEILTVLIFSMVYHALASDDAVTARGIHSNYQALKWSPRPAALVFGTQSVLQTNLITSQTKIRVDSWLSARPMHVVEHLPLDLVRVAVVAPMGTQITRLRSLRVRGKESQ